MRSLRLSEMGLLVPGLLGLPGELGFIRPRGAILPGVPGEPGELGVILPGPDPGLEPGDILPGPDPGPEPDEGLGPEPGEGDGPDPGEGDGPDPGDGDGLEGLIDGLLLPFIPPELPELETLPMLERLTVLLLVTELPPPLRPAIPRMPDPALEELRSDIVTLKRSLFNVNKIKGDQAYFQYD